MRELFKNQIEENKIVDEEMLSKMEYKFYENGELNSVLYKKGSNYKFCL
jgi:hypothetical protein